MSTPHILRHALAFEISANGENGFVQILPAGVFTCLDGRGPFELDAAIATQIIAWFEGIKNDLAFDYEHQSLYAEKNGQPAPAAGWLKRLEWRAGLGLYGYVEWTEKARAMIKAREYRYVSPVFYTAKKGRLLPYLGVPALVTNPAIDGMAEAIAASSDAPQNVLNPPESIIMDLKQLLVLLGLAETATEAEAIAKIKALLSPANAAANAATAASVDMSKFVPVAAVQELQTKVAELHAANAKRDTAELVASAVAEGKLHTPQLQAWAASLAPDALRVFLASAPAIPALASMQTQAASNQQTPAGTATLNDAERQVCTRLGLTDQQFIAAKAA